MDIPRRLRQRPRFKGMPIPFTTLIGKDGEPDFKVLDMAAVRACFQQRLCALCGQSLPMQQPLPGHPFSLPMQIVFIGGPVSAEHRCFVDPAMHEDCARYAVSICPYLANPSGDYSTAQPKHRDEEGLITIRYDMPPERPKKMAFYYCKGYDVVKQFQDGHLVFIAKAWAATKIDWDIIPQLT